MCGISGFMGPMTSRDQALDTVRAMTDAIAHRGPDDSGCWADESVGLALGNRRLAIVDLSPAGHQPMESAEGRYVMTYNGEVYNFGDLRAELEAKGHSFRGHSDTEVMLQAFSEWGVDDAVGRFNGMFAFAVWDRQERVLHLGRDRMGKKPLYYGWVGRTLLFGSELKSLRAHPDFNPGIDRDALTLFLRHNYVPTPYCIYQGFKKLAPGSLLTVRSSTSGVEGPRPFWSFSELASRESLVGDEGEVVERLDEVLREAVRIRMIADVPLGAFLSGGIDSSTIVALMQAQSSMPVRTFTIGFNEPTYNEAEHAKKVAAHLGTDHTELYVSPEDAMAVIPRLPTIYDEPFSDSSQIPTFLVSELARRHVTVSLSGDGGDELFSGYDRYVKAERVWRAIGWAPKGLRRGLGRLLRAPSTKAWDRLLSRPTRIARPGHKVHRLGEVLGVAGPESLYHGLVSHWPRPGEVVIGGTEPRTALTDRNSWPDDRDFVAWASHMDTISYLLDDILVKVDRASMAVSLEARAPLLDPRVVELASSLPTSLKIRNGKGKWPLRSLLHRYVPPELVERPKMGFGVPIDSWLRGPLREWAEDLLEPSRLHREGFLRPEPIRLKWDEYLAGTRAWHYHLWDVLMFQAWLEQTRP